jgi:hypothetical protein
MENTMDDHIPIDATSALSVADSYPICGAVDCDPAYATNTADEESAAGETAGGAAADLGEAVPSDADDFPEGTVVGVGDGDTYSVVEPDGTIHSKGADGTLTSIDPDGTMTITDPDGTVSVINPSGTSRTLDPDGTTINIDRGSHSFTDADGTVRTTMDDGTVVVSSPDGSYSLVEPDGTITKRDSDGTISRTGPGARR